MNEETDDPLDHTIIAGVGGASADGSAEGDAFESELAGHGLSFFDQEPLPHEGYHSAILERLLETICAYSITVPLEERPVVPADDSLEDEEVLLHLLALASVRERELHFFNWRRDLLEQPRLWPMLAGRV